MGRRGLRGADRTRALARRRRRGRRGVVAADRRPVVDRVRRLRPRPRLRPWDLRRRQPLLVASLRALRGDCCLGRPPPACLRRRPRRLRGGTCPLHRPFRRPGMGRMIGDRPALRPVPSRGHQLLVAGLLVLLEAPAEDLGQHRVALVGARTR